MNAEQLKLLAAHVRSLLASPARGVEISHGQALDLTAALVGLRNWPQVLAFPQRVQAHEIDLAAAERLIERIYAKFGDRMTRYPHRMTAESVLSQLAPWQLEAPRDPSRRERLIIVSGDSALGCLRHAGIADAVLMARHSLLWGPVPAGADAPSSFREARMAAWDADRGTTDQPQDWQRAPEEDDDSLDWSSQLSMLADHERIELWMDPDANGQLQLLQMLDWFSRQPQLLGRVFLTHPSTRLGSCTAYAVRQMEPRFDAAGARAIELAVRVWRAYRQPTPQATAALLATDLGALPKLRPAVLDLLRELPAAGSGLRWTEQRLLQMVLERATWKQLRPPMLLAEMRGRERSHTFGYWELGRLLDGLARGPAPALQGLEEGPFDLDLHDDTVRFRRYGDSHLSLTDFDRALLEGEADWAAHNPLRFWWGGTKLTSENLWRWDAANERLIAP